MPEVSWHFMWALDQVWLTGKVFKGSAVVSAPTLIAHVNEQAVIKVSEGSGPFSLAMVVSPQP